MAHQFRKHLIYDLQKRSLDIDDLISVLKCGDDFRLTWGCEYVDFHYETGIIFPTGGSFSLLGFEMAVSVKEYTLSEFISLVKETHPSEFILSVDQIVAGAEGLFDFVKTTCYIDYPQMVTDLEEKGCLTTHPSTNILRTDGRRFTLSDKTGDYDGESYEVDSLGSQFHKDLTMHFTKLWVAYCR